jgi:UDP-N-acetylmuramate: L-alanyl-gamma-D-glutamyl-meso-diaminopimelate ligase
MRVHLIGICGTGMGALAGLLMDAGHSVSGSDVRFDPPIGDVLRRSGARLMPGFDAAHVTPDLELVVVGNVCRSTNVEAVRAAELGLPRASMPGTLERLFLGETTNLVVAGTHGKTTTTSMVAHLLAALGRDPSLLVGGVPVDFPTGHRVGKGKEFVLEGDEYDSAFFEKTPKMWRYRPSSAIVTSLEHDHIDIYPTPDIYAAAFRRFVELVPATGVLVLHGAAAEALALRVHTVARVVTYALAGTSAADWVATPRPGGFDLVVAGGTTSTFTLRVPGRHNVLNATAALALCHTALGIPLVDLLAPLASFGGVRRRQELLGTPGGVALYDDFAHHPTEVSVTLEALSAAHPGARLFAVFEPRSATACRKLHQAAYAAAFDHATDVVLAPIGRGELPDGERLDVPRLVADVGARGRRAVGPVAVSEIVAHVVREARRGDAVVVLSNGAFGGLPALLAAALEHAPAA